MLCGIRNVIIKMGMITFLDIFSFAKNPHVMSESDRWISLRTVLYEVTQTNMAPAPTPEPPTHCDLLLLGGESLLKVIMLLKKGFHAAQGVPQVLVLQEGL